MIDSYFSQPVGIFGAGYLLEQQLGVDESSISKTWTP